MGSFQRSPVELGQPERAIDQRHGGEKVEAVVGGFARDRFDAAGIVLLPAQPRRVGNEEPEGAKPVHRTAQPMVHLDPGRGDALSRRQAGKRLDVGGHDGALRRQRCGQVRRGVALAEHRAHAARVLEQVQRTGDAALGQQRGLHAVLRHQRVGDGFGGGNVAEAHGGRGRGACAAQRDGVRQALPIEPHQPAGHRRCDQSRHGDAVPRRVPLHQLLAAAEDLVAQHDRGNHLAAGRAIELAGRERHRNVVAGMAAEVAGLGIDVVVEIEDAHQGAIGEGGIGGAGAMRPADHRALRRAARPFHHREQGTRGWFIERGEAAADGVEQQKLGLVADGRREIVGADGEHPPRELLDDALSVHARCFASRHIPHAAWFPAVRVIRPARDTANGVFGRRARVLRL